MDLKPLPHLSYPVKPAVGLVEPPAHLTYRALASLLDAVLAFALIFMLLKQFILPYYAPQAFSEFKHIVYHHHTVSQAAPELTFSSLPTFPPAVQKMIVHMRAIITFLLWGYFTALDFFLNGRSIGKRIFRLKVANLITLKEPNWMEISMRSLVKAICFTVEFPFFLIINCLLMFFNKQLRMGHDLIANTIVVEDNEGVLAKPEPELF